MLPKNTCVKIQLRHLHAICFALLATEAESDDRSKVSLHDHFHDLEDTGLMGCKKKVNNGHDKNLTETKNNARCNRRDAWEGGVTECWGQWTGEWEAAGLNPGLGSNCLQPFFSLRAVAK